MAKHPHKILLVNNGKTWKCVLAGCAFFVHRGLEYVLIGKHAVCWNCDDIFEIDEYSLKDGKPKCDECRIPVIAEPVAEPRVPTPSLERTPEQEAAYNKLMTEIHGKDWRKLFKQEETD